MTSVLKATVLVAIVAQCALAQTATIHPVGVNSDASLQGLVVGTGGSIGTTYLLTGVTDGIPFTMTYAEGGGSIAEAFDIPSLTLAVHAGCTYSGSQGVCQEIVSGGSGEATTRIVSVTLTEIAVPVSTSSTTLSRSSASPPSSSITHSTISPSTASTASAPTATKASSAIQHTVSFSGLFFCVSFMLASWNVV